ncbi:hypothetical protein GIB67_028542 [Kingdonia uniflora]|uniref:Aminotransferase-like plant mobile domain-containing protein n=1 Tax=Kingdonia uniflora TaxID=39325 RepID=A0A7J7KVZ1_9MAGN|nr:hypothetical protein GIB67_028542 [Kingdonia uniflora]
MSGSFSSRLIKNASKTIRNSNAEVKRRGNADITNNWPLQLTSDNDPTPSYDELNQVNILPDGWVHISTGSEEIANRDELQCRGSLDKVLKWYRWISVYPTLKKLVDSMGFADFCSINAGNSDNRLIHALVERWWPSIHTFYFPCGELGFTPLDFVMLTGIYFGRGRELSYDERYSKLEEAEKRFPGIISSDMRDKIEWKDRTNIDWQPWVRSTKLRRLEVSVAKVLSFQRVPLVSVPYGHGRLWYLGDRCMRQMIGLDSVPYDPPQDIMEFPRYDRELYQSLKDVNFYDGRDYLVPGVDNFMTYWRLVHPIPKIGCTIAIGDPHDMGWFMDVAGPNDQHRRILIPVMQVPYLCPPTYSTDELWHQNQGMRYAAYEDSRQLTDINTELRRELSRAQEVIRETSDRLAEMSISYQTEPVMQCIYDESLARGRRARQTKRGRLS